ncbi:MAG TPA: S-methyl-5-thioribose-1-phosphate isomerase [Cyclobacteriaceae bacterium]
MKVNGRHYRTIWLKESDALVVQIIDQRKLPYDFVIEDLTSVDKMAAAIKDMHLRGAGLIGAAAGYGMYLATLEARKTNAFDEHVLRASQKLVSTRPTAVNLAWAIDRQLKAIRNGASNDEKVAIARLTAGDIANEDVEYCKSIGRNGLAILREVQAGKGGPVNILTHCNAGWLAFVDYGSATAPIYAAHDEGINVHVWVSETRPRNQGARLTAWELHQHGVPYTVIADNAAGHIMQHAMVDLVITGTDRTTRTGDVCNKVGTYLKALSAKENGIPFFVALPSTSFDWELRDGLKQIPIEQRDENEVKYIEGWRDNTVTDVLLTPRESSAANYGFDVTPARLVTGLITERGICEANEQSILNLFPERQKSGKQPVRSEH